MELAGSPPPPAESTTRLPPLASPVPHSMLRSPRRPCLSAQSLQGSNRAAAAAAPPRKPPSPASNPPPPICYKCSPTALSEPFHSPPRAVSESARGGGSVGEVGALQPPPYLSHAAGAAACLSARTVDAALLATPAIYSAPSGAGKVTAAAGGMRGSGRWRAVPSPPCHSKY